MGLFFNLFIDTGKSKQGNEDLRKYFMSVNKVETSLGSFVMQTGHVENDIGITVSVNETGYTGLYSTKEIEIATEVGHSFYRLLKAAPKFRFAMVGVEAGEWADGQDILAPNFDGYLPQHGLVINNECKLDIDKEFVLFREGYSWVPYLGERG